MNDGSGSSHSERDSDNGPASWWRRLTQRLAGGPRTREDLNELLDGAHESGLVDADAASMIRGVFETGQLQVRDIMVPRAQMVVVERDWPLEQLLASVVESGHSRYPVIGDSRDEIVGILLAKDLLRFTSSEAPDFDIARWLRPAAFVPESKRVNVLLKDFRKSRNHMALVADEYGGVAGLVTIEDVLEQIVGEIDDEHDESESAQILKQDDRRYLVQGLTPIDEFNQYFGAAFSDADFDTVGGLVMHELGHMPRRGESIQIDRFQFNVQRADSRRVHLLQVMLSQT
ncbi:MAG: CBS domain-containing protein [Gammaproteobacteria bacterium]|jgi:magnesium and cobalt transporter|uniref:HlyC/CorC family transporter n=1 Tax=Nevskia sp. TaxID=1929292 RepID=UPI00403671A4|nr:CBS domain-containing protein [Gammaproteobacteria bacterium]